MSEVDGKQVWAQACDRLRALESSYRLRQERLCGTPQSDSGVSRVEDGRQLLNFCSNDYLDLANHPAVKQGAQDAVNKYGAGSVGSRLVCGTLPIHHELEHALARLKGQEAALVFSSGYLACLGVIQALSVRADNSRVPVIFDRLSHASLIDGATQNRTNWRSFPHNDLDSLEIVLKKMAVADWPSAIVITEGVFSMDGDIAPVRAMSELCARYKALLVIDDAHGTGVIGDNGEGVPGMAGISGEPHVVQVGTLSKALGAQGGFVTGPAVFRELMVNQSRTFIFDTALAPASAGAALAALKIVTDEPERRKKLRENVLLFRNLLRQSSCDRDNAAPIIPVLLAGEEEALNASAALRNEGFLVTAIRPPTVPLGTSRLRVTISAAHEEKDIRRLAHAISQMQTA